MQRSAVLGAIIAIGTISITVSAFAHSSRVQLPLL